MNDTCDCCLFSEKCYTFSELIPDSDYYKCKHENSAFYDNLVSSDNTCRLFEDANDYFKKVDRKNKLNTLKDNNRWK